MDKIIILGGGLSGLAAGIRAIELGYEPLILEKNSVSGGLCSTYKRDGAYLDLCIHYLLGIGDEPMRKIYEKLGCLDKGSIIKLPYFYKFYYKDKTITISRNINEFKNELLSNCSFNEDIKEIKLFIKDIKNFRYFPMIAKKSTEIMNRFEYIKTGMGYLKYIPTYRKIARLTIEEYASRYKTDILKEFMLSFMPSSFTMTYLIGVISKFITGNADILNISSSDFSYNVLNKYLSLGGKILYNEEVQSLEYDNNSIKRIITKNNTYEDFSYVINATPLNYFYNNLLDDKYKTELVDKEINDYENNKIIASYVVFYKIKKEYAHHIPHYFIIKNEDNIKVANNINSSIGFRSYEYLKNDDDTITVSAIVDQTIDDYNYWVSLKENNTYKEEKMKKALEIKELLIKKLPFLSNIIEVVDVITPLSIENRCNALYGGYLSNLGTKTSTRGIFEVKSSKLNNLYHAGQMVYVIGGIVGALVNGIFSVDVLDYNIKKK